MMPFADIYAVAVARAGGDDALATRLPAPKSAAELAALADDRYLSMMSHRIFRAGLRHAMVDAKWPAFEDVFLGFDPARVQMMSDDDLDVLTRDARIIRHGGKIKAVRANAAAMVRTAAEAGGFGAWLAAWPGDDTVGLWEALAKDFSQLGGNSGPYFLRMAGRDTFVLTADVVAGLNKWDAWDGTPKGKRDRRDVQQIFNAWTAETGRPLCQISMILALSVN